MIDEGTSPPPRSRRVTIKDVARVAMVAPSTVSKALNRAGSIPESTRIRVEEAAERLGYRPNALARGLRAGMSRSFGAVTDDDEGVFSTAIARGLEHHAAARDYSVFLSNSLGERAREQRHIQAFLDKQVDGLIIMDSVVRPRGAAAAKTGRTPLVYVYCYSTELAVPSVIPDDRAAGRLATTHLLTLGRTKIAHLTGPTSGAAAFEASARRLEGYMDSHREADLEVDPRLVVAADWDARSGYQAMSSLLAHGHRPDAVVCSNDYVAVGAIEAIKLSGLRVPEDVAVTGFDNRVIASGLSVPLTTVAADHDEMGRVAMSRLFEAVDGVAQHHELIEVAPRLITRDSTTGRAD
ncbi:MAG: LacI family DNA-binding transcriptional regulator [Protaetiibacter sp.]